MRISNFLLGAVAGAAGVTFAANISLAQDAGPALYDGHVLLEGFAGDDNGGDVRLFLPLWQDPTNIFFLYPYYYYSDDGDFQAAGGGLGYRTQVSDNWLLGAYGFLDGTRQYDEWFGQASVGLEAMSPGAEVRVNAYIPFGGSERTEETDHVVLNPDTHMLDILLGNSFGMYGVDGEVGARVLDWGDNEGDNEIRVFGGGYTWWHDDVDTVTGVSARFEARFNDLRGFPDGSRLTLGGAVRHDNVDDTNATVMASFRLPLGPSGTGTRHYGLNARMDEDISRRWGGRIATSYEETPAYFLDGRATGTVVFTDGLADTARDGWTPPTATELDQAIDQAGTNGILVALDQYGDILTPGATLLEGQAIIGGGTMFPVISMDGGTFYYNAPGGPGNLVLESTSGISADAKLASVVDPDTQFVLTLDDFNTVFGIGVVARQIEENGKIEDVRLGGINGEGTTNSWITGTTVELAFESGPPLVDVLPPAPNGQNPGDPGGSLDESNSLASPTIDNSHLIGIALANSTGATLFNNIVGVSMDGLGGDGINTEAGNGAGGLDGVEGAAVGTAAGEGGSARASSGGTGVRSSSAYGVDLTQATDAMVLANTIEVSIKGTGGKGGDATGGNGGNGGASHGFARGGEGGDGGAATGGNGGTGLDSVAAGGIVANEAINATFLDNYIKATLLGAGGQGGSADGGNAGNGGSSSLLAIGAEGGDATSGFGGAGISNRANGDSSTVVAIELTSSQGASVENNMIEASATGTGGNGGAASSGDGTKDDAGEGFFTIRAAGVASGGGAAGGVFATSVTGIAQIKAENAWVSGNTVNVAMQGKGGDGGDAVGGAGGQTGSATGGFAATGIKNAEVTGILAFGATGNQFLTNTVGVRIDGQGGKGGAGTGGSPSGVDDNPDGQSGADGFGGSGGEGIFDFSATAFALQDSTNAWVEDNQIGLAVDAYSGAGGAAFGGNGSTSPSRTADAGGAATGGKSTTALQIASLSGLGLAGSTGGELSGNDVVLSVKGIAGNGGEAFGGEGGANLRTSSGKSGARFGGAGGAAIGGQGGFGVEAVEIVGVDGVTDTVLNDTTVALDAIGAGGDGGQATGGTGGGGSTGEVGGGEGGNATGGEGGRGLTDFTANGIAFENNSSGASTTNHVIDMQVAGFGGLGGWAASGNGGATASSEVSMAGGAAGVAHGGAGGAGEAATFLTGVSAASDTIDNATIETGEITIALTGTGGIGGQADGGRGGDHNGTGDSADGGRGGDATGGDGGDGGPFSSPSIVIGVDVSTSSGASVLSNLVDVSTTVIGGAGGAGNGGRGGDITAADDTGSVAGAGGSGFGGVGGHGTQNALVIGVGGSQMNDAEFIGNTVTAALSATGANGGDASGGNGGDATSGGVRGVGGSGFSGSGGSGIFNVAQLHGLAAIVANNIHKSDNAVETLLATGGGNGGRASPGSPGSGGGLGVIGGVAQGSDGFPVLPGAPVMHAGYAVLGPSDTIFGDGNTYTDGGSCLLVSGTSTNVTLSVNGVTC